MVRSKASSEFGGVPGRIAPPPHDYKTKAAEQLRLMHSTDSTDPLDNMDAALLREQVELEGRNPATEAS